MDHLFNSHTYCLNASSKTEQTYMKKKNTIENLERICFHLSQTTVILLLRQNK